MFPPRGDGVKCIGDGHYLDTCVDGVVGSGVDVVEYRHMRQYRGAHVLDIPGTGLHCVAISYGKTGTAPTRESATSPANAYGDLVVRYL